MDVTQILTATGAAIAVIATLAAAVTWVVKAVVGDLPQRIAALDRTVTRLDKHMAILIDREVRNGSPIREDTQP